jgi:DNA-binding XRE family transcriptional regulator
MKDNYEHNVKIAVLLKVLRGALFMTQNEFAHWLDIPRVTITRAEKLRLPLKVDILLRINRMAREAGLEIDFMAEEPVLKITEKFLAKSNITYGERLAKYGKKYDEDYDGYDM